LLDPLVTVAWILRVAPGITCQPKGGFSVEMEIPLAAFVVTAVNVIAAVADPPGPVAVTVAAAEAGMVAGAV
jgi:hypothetical protein